MDRCWTCFCRKPSKFFRPRVTSGAYGRGLAERLGASARAKAFQTPGTSISQRLIATRLPSHPGLCTAGQRLYLWAGILNGETVRALGIGGHNYPSKLTPIEMNGSTPFSAGVIVAVCLAADSKARVYLGLQPERLETTSLPLFFLFFLIRGKGKFCFCRLVGWGAAKQYSLDMMVLSTYNVLSVWSEKGWVLIQAEGRSRGPHGGGAADPTMWKTMKSPIFHKLLPPSRRSSLGEPTHLNPHHQFPPGFQHENPATVCRLCLQQEMLTRRPRDITASGVFCVRMIISLQELLCVSMGDAAQCCSSRKDAAFITAGAL